MAGIGSPHGDDQVGWDVARRIASAVGPRAEVRRETSPAGLVSRLDGRSRLIVVDACQGLGPPGRLLRWRWPLPPAVASASWRTTHDISLPAALALAEILGLLPDDTVVWAVVLDAVGPGHPGRTAVVDAAARRAARAIVAEL